MNRLVLLFWQICLFRKGPQDVPLSSKLFQYTIPAYVSANFLVDMFNYSSFGVMLVMGVNLLTTFGFVCSIMYLVNKMPRAPQTMGALLGTNATIHFVQIPTAACVAAFGSGKAVLVLLLLKAWLVMVNGHVFRHAFDISSFGGLGLAILNGMLCSLTVRLISGSL